MLHFKIMKKQNPVHNSSGRRNWLWICPLTTQSVPGSQLMVSLSIPLYNGQTIERNGQTMGWQYRGMDRETISWDPGTGTQPQQMEETGAQLVQTVPRQLHQELREPKTEEKNPVITGMYMQWAPGQVSVRHKEDLLKKQQALKFLDAFNENMQDYNQSDLLPGTIIVIQQQTAPQTKSHKHSDLSQILWISFKSSSTKETVANHCFNLVFFCYNYCYCATLL